MRKSSIIHSTFRWSVQNAHSSVNTSIRLWSNFDITLISLAADRRSSFTTSEINDIIEVYDTTDNIFCHQQDLNSQRRLPLSNKDPLQNNSCDYVNN